MLEIRYNTDTKKLTAWCGDETQFGNLDRGRPEEAIIVLDNPIPKKPCTAYLYDEATQSLIDNPAYVEPELTKFERLNPVEGVELRLDHVEEWLEERHLE